MKNNALISARKEKGLTQEQLAKKIGVRKTTISNWETGYSNPSLHKAMVISKILNKSVYDLFKGGLASGSNQQGDD